MWLDSYSTLSDSSPSVSTAHALLRFYSSLLRQFEGAPFPPLSVTFSRRWSLISKQPEEVWPFWDQIQMDKRRDFRIQCKKTYVR